MVLGLLDGKVKRNQEKRTKLEYIMDCCYAKSVPRVNRATNQMNMSTAVDSA